MKKLTALMLALLLCCTCLTALAYDALYPVTQKVLDYLNEVDVNYKVSYTPGNPTEEITIPAVYQELDKHYDITVRINGENGYASLLVWDICSYTDEQLDLVCRFLSRLNLEVRYFKFYTEDDNTVSLCYQLPLMGDVEADGTAVVKALSFIPDAMAYVFEELEKGI